MHKKEKERGLENRNTNDCGGKSKKIQRRIRNRHTVNSPKKDTLETHVDDL